ncbi:hypothetical protein ACQUZK_10495, partial [Streptococcus pyogenes]|uniref:hypothetical protein n=1 Tax=Streptococcus pyogenes TaxID=1314 RepID=UPI003D9FB913
GVVAAVVVLLVGAVVWFLAMLSGGIDDLFSTGGPSPDDERVVEARDAHAELLATTLDEVVDGREVVASADDGDCQE